MTTWHCLWCETEWVGDRTCWMCHKDPFVVELYVAISLSKRRLDARDALEKGKVA